MHHYVSTKIFQKQPFAYVLQNKCSHKFRKIHKKRFVPLPVLFFCEFFNFFPFLQSTSGRLLLKLAEYLFLESVFVTLDKSILLHNRYPMSKYSEILILVCRKTFSAFFNATLFSSCDIPQFRLSLLNWYFMIGNIFGQSWLIWASFHTASDHQSFPLLGIDLKKNVLTKHFQKKQKQPFAFDL